MLRKSAAVAAQGSHRGWWDWGVLDATGDGWNVCAANGQLLCLLCSVLP